MSIHHHWESLSGAFARLLRHPFGTAMTLSVIAIALALPAGLLVLLGNAGQLLSKWEEQAQVSLFLSDATTPAQAQSLRQEILKQPGIRQVRYLSKDDARVEFKKTSGFGDALNALQNNPLPASLVIGIDPTYYNPDQIQSLVQRWSRDARVELAQYDLAWVARLQAILDLARQAVLILAGLLAIGVVVIIGNTIRLNIINRREEIAISKLIGASNRFARRPFLYLGFLQGALGGALAWAIVALGIILLQEPTVHLAALYGSPFRLTHLQPEEGAILLVIGGLLGWLGSFLVAGRQIRAIN